MADNSFFIRKVYFDLEDEQTIVSVYLEFEIQEGPPFCTGWLYKRFPKEISALEIFQGLADLQIIGWERGRFLPFGQN